MNNLPLGFGMALAQNTDAMKYFTSLPPEKQKAIVSHTKNIKSKKEMHTFVDSLNNNFTM